MKRSSHLEITTNILNFYLSNRYGSSCIGGIPEWFQVALFIKTETHGKKNLTISEKNQIAHLIEGKKLYDLQIKQFHEELSMWVRNGWGWKPVADAALEDAYKQRKHFRTYVKALIKIIRNIEATSCYDVLTKYSGFSEKEKNKIIEYYMYAK
jgi:hypothetical protein